VDRDSMSQVGKGGVAGGERRPQMGIGPGEQ